MSIQVTTSLLDLARQASSAVQRAQVAKHDAAAQQVFVSMHQEVAYYETRLAPALFCLRSDKLDLRADERERLASTLRTAAGALTALRERLAAAPEEVRDGPVWKSYKQSMIAVEQVGDEVRVTAVHRLLDRLPRPKQGLISMLPPHDARRREYVHLQQQYELRTVEVTSPAELETILKITSELAALEAQIDDAVPDAHRRDWKALIEGRLTLAILEPDFDAWLRQSQHAGPSGPGVSMSDLAVEFLDVVEAREATLLCWGYVDGGHTREELVDRADSWAIGRDPTSSVTGAD